MKERIEFNSNGTLNRRDVSKRMALVGAGVLAAPALESTSAAPITNRDINSRMTQPGEKSKLTVKEVYARAREALYPTCHVCPQCDGIACAGEEIGGVGSGMSFQNNFTSLQRVKLNMRTLIDDPELEKKPDTTTIIFGRKLSFPALAAPKGPVVLRLGKGIKEDVYYDAIIGGCVDAGAGGGIGNNANLSLEVFKRHCKYIEAVKGQALMGLKPRPADKMIPLFEYLELAGTMMVTIDTDSGGRYPVSDLSKIVKATKIPIVVKGIMTIDDARRAADTGVAGIVVSNHGGRRLDHTPGTAEVLPEIAEEMKGKLTIFTDGCVHYGTDVLKYLALGADAVLVGRHILRAAYGAGREGVALFMNTLQAELAGAMRMTAVANTKKINRGIITF